MGGGFKQAFLLAFFFFVVILEASCEKEEYGFVIGDKQTMGAGAEVVHAFNQSINNVQEFIAQNQRQGKVVAVYFGRGEDVCQLVFDDGSSVDVSLESPRSDVGFPDITVGMDVKGYYWRVNNTQSRRAKEKHIRLRRGVDMEVKYERGAWWYRTETKQWESVNTIDIPKIRIVPFSSTGCMSSALFSTGCQVDIEWETKIFIMSSNVSNQSFYKDIFLDAGYGLTNRTYLPAATYLGLSLECFSTSLASDTVIQNQIIGGDSEDSNGRLLYPDGQPRYKLLFVVGGKATTHGISLGTKSRERMRTFYYNGGSYVGTCAGAFFSSNGYNDNVNYPYYLGIFPSVIRKSGVRNSVVGMNILSDSPLLKYYSYGEDNVVSNIRHSGGGFVEMLPMGAEVLAWNDTTSDSLLQGKPAIWSYKKDKKNGRLVVSGSHPESYSSGERRDLMAAMLQYAIEGRGVSPIKGVLKNGEVREMNKSSEDNDPNYTKIGDLQYHHFVVYIPQEAINVVFQVSSPVECDMQLMLSNKTIPYNGKEDYVASIPGSNQSLHFSTLEPGLWYVSVKCNTTVTATTGDWGQSYSGRTDVLNGVPYSIGVSWDELRVDSTR